MTGWCVESLEVERRLCGWRRTRQRPDLASIPPGAGHQHRGTDNGNHQMRWLFNSSGGGGNYIFSAAPAVAKPFVRHQFFRHHAAGAGVRGFVHLCPQPEGEGNRHLSATCASSARSRPGFVPYHMISSGAFWKFSMFKAASWKQFTNPPSRLRRQTGRATGVRLIYNISGRGEGAGDNSAGLISPPGRGRSSKPIPPIEAITTMCCRNSTGRCSVHQRPEVRATAGRARIFTLPVEGGTPKQIYTIDAVLFAWVVARRKISGLYRRAEQQV